MTRYIAISKSNDLIGRDGIKWHQNFFLPKLKKSPFSLFLFLGGQKDNIFKTGQHFQILYSKNCSRHKISAKLKKLQNVALFALFWGVKIHLEHSQKCDYRYQRKSIAYFRLPYVTYKSTSILQNLYIHKRVWYTLVSKLLYLC